MHRHDAMMAKAVANGVILAPADGGHDYVRRAGVAYWLCACGAEMWASGSRGPTPFGRCPNKPTDVQRAMARRG